MTKDEAIKILEEFRFLLEGSMNQDKPAFDLAIKSLSAETEWIPCSERLPSAEREGQVRGLYLITNERGQVSVKAFEFTDGYVEYGWNSDFEILAWMPLPKPYGERREP